MQAQYVAIYHADGILSIPSASFDLVATENTSVALAVGSHLEAERRLLAEWHVLGQSLMGTFAPQSNSRVTSEDMLRARVNELGARLDISPEAVYWVIKVSKDVPGNQYATVKWFGEVGMCIVRQSDGDLAQRANSMFETASSAWAAVAPETWSSGARLIGDLSIVWGDHGRRIYPLSLSMRAEGRASGQGSEEMLRATARAIMLLEQQPDLTSVSRLLSESALAGTHRLQAFMAAWTALEIFVGKTFPRYERSFMLEMSQGGVSAAVAGRIKEIMKDKYRLVDKFSLVAANLAGDEARKDIETFKTIKNQRDEYFHSMKFEVDQLPLPEATALVRKYLRLFLGTAPS